MLPVIVPAVAPLPICRLPPVMVVRPVKVLSPLRVSAPEPSLVRVPVPLMSPARVWALERRMVRLALSTISPATEPVKPPLPSCRVPALMVVTPV